MSAKSKKSTKSKSTKAVKRIPHVKQNPFTRPKSVYRYIWNVLYRCRKAGISRERLVEVVDEQLRLDNIRKTEQQILYSVQVVVSSRKDKLSHPSIRKPSDIYYVEICGQNYRLHLKEQK